MSNPGRPLQGMILAAGYGTRLAPLTDHIPKPLLPLGHATLLDRIIESMDLAGVGKIAVNTHHQGDQIAEHLAARPDASRFTVFPEKEILGTGGALDGARDFLAQEEFFLLHNGDVLSDLDLGSLVRAHQKGKPLATLALADWPAVNSVIMADDDGETGSLLSIADMPQGIPQDAGLSLTYTGIGVFSRELLAGIGPGFSSMITPLVVAMAHRPGCVQGFAPATMQWDDLGTLSRWLAAWDKHTQPQEPSPAKLQVKRLTGHGSDRKFWRLSTGDWSAVAVQNPKNIDHPSRGLGTDPPDEFKYFLSIGRFLKKHDLGAPEFLSIDEDEKIALMEDLGPTSLYSTSVSAGRDLSEVKKAYHRVIDTLILLQEHTQEAMQDCPEAVSRCLDETMLCWETSYFRDNYLLLHRGCTAEDIAHLDQPFQKLATRVARQPRVLLHRDFQSQNIMLPEGEPRLVDFQGLRLGPIGYDVMSLAFDPYVDFSLSDRWALVEYFCEKVTHSEKLASFSGPMPDEQTLLSMATGAGLQRLMQALGAYTFLGLVRGKADFLAHIPRAESLLLGVLARYRSEDDSLSALASLLGSDR